MEEVFQHQLDDHTKILALHETRLDTLSRDLDDRITYTQFYWIIGVLITVVGGMFFLIWQSLQSVTKVTNTTQSTVSYIQGTLQHADITK